MEDKTPETVIKDDSLIIYEKGAFINTGKTYAYSHILGYPFYKLTKRECFPLMNLFKTFDVKSPKSGDFLKNIKKNKWTQLFTDSLLILLTDVEHFAKNERFLSCQTAAILEIFFSCLQYFQQLPALDKNDFLKYFRDTLLLYSVHDPPECMRILNGTECMAIAKLFHELVGNNFEIMKYVLVPVYEIKIKAMRGN